MRHRDKRDRDGRDKRRKEAKGAKIISFFRLAFLIILQFARLVLAFELMFLSEPF